MIDIFKILQNQNNHVDAVHMDMWTDEKQNYVVSSSFLWFSLIRRPFHRKHLTRLMTQTNLIKGEGVCLILVAVCLYLYVLAMLWLHNQSLRECRSETASMKFSKGRLKSHKVNLCWSCTFPILGQLQVIKVHVLSHFDSNQRFPQTGLYESGYIA